MIKVQRGVAPVPSGLLVRARETREQFFRANIERLGQVRMPKPDSIALRHLLKPLRSAFNAKCGFCEQRAEDGILSLFRPTSVQDIGETVASTHLHYSWLAYEWDNLIYCCVQCATAKGSLFPVRGDRASLGSSVAECRLVELPHLVDPTFDAPEEHLRFDVNGNCVSLTERGGRTLAIFNLNRSQLIDERKALIRAVWAIFSEGIRFAKIENRSNAVIVSSLVGFTDSQAEFAGTARSVMTTWIREHAGTEWIAELQKQFMSQGWYGDVNSSEDNKPIKVVDKTPQAIGRLRLPSFAGDALTRVEIENFKGIERADFNLPLPGGSIDDDFQATCLILLGENSVGKSTVLEAISLALAGSRNISKLNLSATKYLRRSNEWSISAKDGHVRLYFNERLSPDVTLKVDYINRRFDVAAGMQAVLAAYGSGRFYSERKTSASARARAPSISSLFNSFSFLDDPVLWLTDTTPADFDAAVRALREILMLQDEAAKFIKEGTSEEPIDIFIVANGQRTPLNSLSDGYRAVIAMATDIIRNMLKYYSNLESAKGIVLIDEIDTHLHPRWKIEILRRMRHAFPQVQFIVSTHDPLCLRGARDGEVAVLKKYDTNTEVITNLPNVEALSIEQLLTSEYFGLLSTDDLITERRKERHLQLTLLKNRTGEEEEELKNVRNALLSKLQFGQSDEGNLLYEAATEYLREKKIARSSRQLSSRTVEKMLSILKAEEKD